MHLSILLYRCATTNARSELNENRLHNFATYLCLEIQNLIQSQSGGAEKFSENSKMRFVMRKSICPSALGIAFKVKWLNTFV